jgi:hypothetical protein
VSTSPSFSPGDLVWLRHGNIHKHVRLLSLRSREAFELMPPDVAFVVAYYAVSCEATVLYRGKLGRVDESVMQGA